MSKWTSVTETLPVDLAPVLIYVDWGVCLATYDEQQGKFVQDTTQANLYSAYPLSYISEQPTHWMPVPETPNE